MSLPTRGDGPELEPEAVLVMQLPAAITTNITPTTDAGNGPAPIPPAAPEVEQRAHGMRRVTTARSTSAACMTCELRTPNVGAASSHARSSGHPVAVDYSSTFVFLPPGTAGAA